MNPAVFAHPDWAVPLAGIVAAAILALSLANLRAGRRVGRLFRGRAPRRQRDWTSDAALALALLATALALVGPRIGERTLKTPSTGVDVVFLVDVSRSMDATDVAPSRLDRARRAVEQLLIRLAASDRAALAAFAGTGVLLTPLTPDHGSLAELLQGLDTDLFRPASSRIDAGVTASIEAFEDANARPRVLFVLSDGEDAERRRNLGAALAVQENVRVLTAAIGSDGGGRVPVDGSPLRDADGRPVVSRRDAARLATLATATGGEPFVGDEWGRLDFDRAAAAIRRDVSLRPGEPVARRVGAVRVAPFAALAFSLLLLEGLPRPRSLARAGWVAPVVAALSLAAAVAGLGDPATARARAGDAPTPEASEDPRSLIARGLAQLDRGHHEAAARSFLAAGVYARDPAVAAVAHYDRGVAALAAGDAATARDAFFDTLALDPSDDEARFNLEWALAVLERVAPPEPPPASEARGDPPAPIPPDAATDAQAAVPAPSEATGAATETSALGPEQRRRLLQRIPDDPSHWLRAAGGRRSGRGGGPAW